MTGKEAMACEDQQHPPAELVVEPILSRYLLDPRDEVETIRLRCQRLGLNDLLFVRGSLETFCRVRHELWRKTMISGAPIRRRKRDRYSIRYSHRVGNEWVCASLDEPDLLDRLLSAAEWVQLPLRDRLIVLIACRYGVCIRDILRLTIGDWRACECRLEMQVHRQAIRGQNAGILHLGPDTASLLRAYIHGERKEHDPEHRELVQLAATDPLFLTAEGCAYGYQAFVPQWETLCQEAGISLPLHGLRHWFVMRMLRKIEERTHDPGEQQRYKAALIKYMGWQSPKTLRAYEIEYHAEKEFRVFEEFRDELLAKDSLPLNEGRPAIERREEPSFWQNYWHTAGDR